MNPPLRYALLASLTFLSGLTAADPVFRPETIDAEIEIGYGLAIADVDGDGFDDILLADKREVVWYANPGLGSTNLGWKKHVMARNLTLRDNVCIAARDLDGDGRCEVAVGGNWNPRETTSETDSGSIHYLIAPEDPTQPWESVALPHEPTVHRMHWRRSAANRWDLVVLPLHGRGNVDAKGAPVQIFAYRLPPHPAKASPEAWTRTLLDASLHLTHNFDLAPTPAPAPEALVVGGAEGILHISASPKPEASLIIPSDPARPVPGSGEIRFGPAYLNRGTNLPAYSAIEPMHGNEVVVYEFAGETPGEHQPIWKRVLLDDTLAEGHALACGDLLGTGREQIVAGWRKPDANGAVGIRLYDFDPATSSWNSHDIDSNTMAAEDLKLADLDGDGRLDIIAAGRATQNLIIYWNRSPKPKPEPLAPGWIKHELWSGANCSTAVAGDFTGDGLIDVILSAGGSEILLTAPDWHPTAIRTPKPERNRSCIHGEAMDVDGDGDLDFVGAARELYWLENPGGDAATSGEWIAHDLDRDLTGLHCVVRADINGDGIDDLVANEFNPNAPFANSILWLEPRRSGELTWVRHVFAAGDAPGGNHYMGVGDIDGDGDLDIACAAKGKPFRDGNWFAWWENTGSTPWKKHLLAEGEVGATCILPADLDGDGDLDFMASRGHGHGVLWFENLGGGRFAQHEVDPLIAGPHCLTLGDFDGDGDIDAATTAKDDRRTVWYENDGKGGFTPHDIDDRQAAYDIRAIDFDGDGDLDLLVAGQASKNVVLYENVLNSLR